MDEPHSPCRIVIAEDDPTLRYALRTMLDLEDGFTVVGEAADGDQAIELVERICGRDGQCPDVLLLDLNMPRMDGFGVLDRLRASCPAVRVVVHSGEEEDAARARLETIGPHSFVRKGDIAQLTTELRAACAASSSDRHHAQGR